MTSIYVLIDPHSREIRYVGKTDRGLDARLRGHVRRRLVRNHREAWIAKLARFGSRPRIVLVQEVASSDGAGAERYWISYFRALGCPLVNGTDGGDGVPGLRFAAASRAKMSASASLRMARIGPDGRRALNRPRQEAAARARRGAHWTDEQRRTISERTRAAMQRPDVRAKIEQHQIEMDPAVRSEIARRAANAQWAARRA